MKVSWCCFSPIASRRWIIWEIGGWGERKGWKRAKESRGGGCRTKKGVKESKGEQRRRVRRKKGVKESTGEQGGRRQREEKVKRESGEKREWQSRCGRRGDKKRKVSWEGKKVIKVFGGSTKKGVTNEVIDRCARRWLSCLLFYNYNLPEQCLALQGTSCSARMQSRWCFVVWGWRLRWGGMQHEHLQLVSGFVAPLSLLAFLHTTSPLAPDLGLDTKIRIGESAHR